MIILTKKNFVCNDVMEMIMCDKSGRTVTVSKDLIQITCAVYGGCKYTAIEVANFFSKVASQNGTLKLFAGGRQVKSLVPLIDVARCFKFMEERDDLSSETFNQIVKNEDALLVYKTPTCGCCKKWIEHLKEDGLNIDTEDLQNLDDIKSMYDIKPQYRSCHTAVSSKGFIFEGHIPVSYTHLTLPTKA